MISRGARRSLYLATLLGLGPSISPAQASEALYLSEEAFLTDIPEITSATRLSQRLTESPASISIITRDMISASGARNIPDLLRLVPGFQSFHVSANKFATTYHGASDNFPRRQEVMVDGRSVYLPLLSTVDWTSLGLNLQDIERVEVVRGSNVPTQGSNAFMGSINIITREPAAEQGGYFSATAGSMDTRDLHFGHSDSLGLWSYRLSGGHEQNDGSDRFGDRLKRNYLSFSGSYTPTLTDTLWIQAGVDRGHTYVGQADRADTLYHRREHDSNYQSIKYQNIYSDTGTLQLTAYHNYLNLEVPRLSYADVFNLLGSQLADNGIAMNNEELTAYTGQFLQMNHWPLWDREHGTTHSYDIELQVSEALDRLRWVTGLGYRYDSAASDILLQDGDVSEERWRAFANVDWAFMPAWSVNTGAMFEHSSDDADAFSFRHALIHRPDDVSSLRLGYSISERLPSLLEKNTSRTLIYPTIPGVTDGPLYDYDYGANAELDAERVKTHEIGYFRTFPHLDANLDLRLFKERVSSGISGYYQPLPVGTDTDDPPRVGISANNYSWTNRGAEVQLQQHITDTFSYLFNYAYINTRTATWDRGAKGIKPFKDSITPEHTASLMLSWRPVHDLNLSLMHYYMDSVDWFEGDLRDDYQRTDLRAARRWAVGPDSELEAALTVQNAFGPTYAEFYEYNLFDRRVWLQLQLRYH